MKISRLTGLALAAALGWSVSAEAAVQKITCDGMTSGQLATLLNSGLPNGTVVEITGICLGDVQIPPDFELTNHLNSAALIATDGIQGEVTSSGSATINGLMLKGYATNTGEQSNLNVSTPGTVIVKYSKVTGAQLDGIVVQDGGIVEIVQSTISGNGVAKSSGENDGIDVDTGGFLYDSMAGAASTITGNNGYGILAESGGNFGLDNTKVSNDGISEIEALGGVVSVNSGATIVGATSSTQPAIQALSSSRVVLFGANVSGPGGALLIENGSSAVLGNAKLQSNKPAYPTLEAGSASSIILAGGNTIGNSATGGVAVKVDKNSNVTQFLTSRLMSGATDAVDSVTGAGLVLEESSIDLGTGLVGTTPGLTWTGNLTVSENSVAKLQGGVAMSGSLSLTEGANGLFYLANGGTNVVSGSVTCPTSGAAPSSHVANPTDVTPNVTIGTVTPACLSY